MVIKMNLRIGKRFKNAVSFAVALSVILCAAVIMPPNEEQSVRAATSNSITDKQDKIKDLEERNKQIDSEMASIDGNISDNEKLQDLAFEKLANAKDQVDNYNNLLYYKEQDIDAKQADINALDIQIEAKKQDIAKTQSDIESLEAENEKNLDEFGEMLHALYITENTDMFSVLAESSDIYDLLVRTKMMLNITKQNNDLMEELKASLDKAEEMLAKLEKDAEDLDAYHQKLNQDMTELESAKADLEKERQAAQELSNQYNSEYNHYSEIIENFEYRQSQLKNEQKANKDEIEEYEKQIQREIMLAQQSSTQVYQEGDWIYPLDPSYRMITTEFGYDPWRSGMHNAVDISGGGINGANIYATKGGTIITAKDNYIPGYSYGKYVVIDHGNGYSSLYAHCSAIYVTVGQVVNQGDVIAAVGSTGWSTGPHLHFAINKDGTPLPPFDFIPRF